jgi:hypothetical protein
MQKLIIQDISQVNAYTYAIRFSGFSRPLNAINSFLQRQSRNKAYWDENGKAWIIHLDFLRHISRHFENVERGLVIADRKAVQKQIISLARRR